VRHGVGHVGRGGDGHLRAVGVELRVVAEARRFGGGRGVGRGFRY